MEIKASSITVFITAIHGKDLKLNPNPGGLFRGLFWGVCVYVCVCVCGWGEGGVKFTPPPPQSESY